MQYKLDGLKRRRAQASLKPTDDLELIAGAGPGGLFAGLIAALQELFHAVKSTLVEDTEAVLI